jgi:hypothetical protein
MNNLWVWTAGLFALASMIFMLLFAPRHAHDEPVPSLEPVVGFDGQEIETVFIEELEPFDPEFNVALWDDYGEPEPCQEGFGPIEILLQPGGTAGYDTLVIACGSVLAPPETLYRWNDRVRDYLRVVQ